MKSYYRWSKRVSLMVALGLLFGQFASALTVQQIIAGQQQGQVLGAATLALDPSTPASSKGAGNRTTASFTPPSGSVLVIAVQTNANNFTQSISLSDNLSSHLSYNLVQTKGNNFQDVYSRLYWAYNPTSQPMTVTATVGGSQTLDYNMLTVLVFTGANISAPIGASGGNRAATGVINDSYISTADNSLGWFVTGDWSASAVPTAGTNQSVYDSYTISGQDTYAVIKQNSVTATAGTTVNMTTTAPASGAQITHIYFEVIPSGTGPTPTPTPTPTSTPTPTATPTPTSTPTPTAAPTPTPTATPTPTPTPPIGSYYVSPSGNDANSCAASQNISLPKKTLSSAFGCLAPGSTLVLRNGTYAENIANIPNGSAGNYIDIKAENDGGAILTGSFDMAHTNQYIQMEGLSFESANQKSIVGNHLKFLRDSFSGGCGSGNCVNTVIGSNDFNDTADILIEDSWSYGSGGRYNFLIYNADRVLLRRVVVRHDGGWADNGGGNPEAGINFYDSADSWCENCLVIDSNLTTYSTWSGAYYSVKNSSVNHATTNNGWLGSMAINNKDLGMRQDGTISNVTITDFVAVDNPNGGISFGTSGVTGAINRATVINKKITSSGDMMAGFGSFGASSPSASNVIVAHQANGDSYSVGMTYFDTYQNGGSSNGTGKQTYNPETSGLLYPIRIESGAALKTAGSGGGQIGAQVVNQIGASGSLKGDANWNVDAGVPLWPWPNESRIKQEMCANVGIARGFCSDVSLTNYIMNYLGNGNPYSSGSTPTPLPGDFNLDHIVNSLDFSLLNSNWFKTTNISTYDLQTDGIINSFDYAILKSNWGKTW